MTKKKKFKLIVSLTTVILFIPCVVAAFSFFTPLSQTADVLHIEIPEPALLDITAEYASACGEPEAPDKASIPYPAHFAGDTLYFFRLEPTRLNAFEDVAATLHTFNLTTGEQQTLGRIEPGITATIFSMSYMDYLFTDDALVYPCKVDGTLQINRLFYETGVIETILTETDGPLFASHFAQAEDGTLIVRLGAGDSDQYRQKIYLCGDGEFPELIHEDVYAGDSAYTTYTALTTWNDSLWLMRSNVAHYRQQVDLVEMTRNGTIRRTMELPGTEDYYSPIFYVDEISIYDAFPFGGRIFFRWYGSTDTLPRFLSYKSLFTQTREVPVPEIPPWRLISPEPVKGRYLLFSTYWDIEKDHTLRAYLYDRRRDAWIALHFPFGENTNVYEYDMLCNEQGDMILHLNEITEDGERLQRIVKVDFDAIRPLLNA